MEDKEGVGVVDWERAIIAEGELEGRRIAEARERRELMKERGAKERWGFTKETLVGDRGLEVAAVFRLGGCPLVSWSGEDRGTWVVETIGVGGCSKRGEGRETGPWEAERWGISEWRSKALETNC